MFGKKNLQKDGATIEGVLIESDDQLAFQASMGYHVKVRVEFPDGTSSEFSTRLHVKQSGARGIGATVPVRYDPDDHTKIEVDEKEIQRRHDVDEQQREAAFSATPAPLASADPFEQLQELWDQKKAMDYRGSELSRSGAPREQVGAWVHESEALNSRFRALKMQHPDWTPRPSAD